MGSCIFTNYRAVMSLPLLPGNTFSKTLGQEKFNKSHHFDMRLDEPMWVGETKPGVGGSPLPTQKVKSHSKLPPSECALSPAWIAYDRQVLCFNGYFQEAVHEKNDEQYRIRKGPSCDAIECLSPIAIRNSPPLNISMLEKRSK